MENKEVKIESSMRERFIEKGARVETYGYEETYNKAKQETIDRLLEIK